MLIDSAVCSIKHLDNNICLNYTIIVPTTYREYIVYVCVYSLYSEFNETEDRQKSERESNTTNG